MVVARYAGVGEQCPQFQVLVETGGQLSAATRYFSFQLQNRCGFNLPSVSGATTIPANSKVKITIPESVRKPAWDIHYFVVSCGTTADASTHVEIARVAGYQFGQGIPPQSVLQDLPYTLELTRDEHIALAPSVANIGNLPTGANRLDGQVRFITVLGMWLEYRADSTLDTSVEVYPVDFGCWCRVGGASTYVSSTTSGVGSDRDLTSINPVTAIPTPKYPGLNRVAPDWESKYFLYNNTTYPLQAGTEFGIELEYNNKRSPDLLAGLFMVRFLGFAASDGTLRTEDSEGRDFPNVGGYFPWSPRQETPFATIDDLAPGEAIVLGVKPFFSVAELNNQVPPKSIIGVIPVIRTQSGDYNPLGKLLPGGAVYNLADKYRVVPGIGLSAFILSGSAIVSDYDFPVKPKRGIFGLLPNTAGQKIVINGNGAVFAQPPSYTLIASEALRALISTAAGESSAGEWSSYQAIIGAQGVQITVNYPCNSNGIGIIRSDYPDVIAGNNKGNFNPPTLKIYLQRQDTLEIRAFSGFQVLASTTQSFNISNWADGLVVSLPSSGGDFSLFSPGASTVASSISGSFPVTNYRACYSFQYDGNQITSISHAAPPCIREWRGDFQPPSILIGTVTTLPAGSQATVVNVGTSTNLILNFGIPQGAPGQGGGGSSEEEDVGFGGKIVCESGCSGGSGKAFEFYAAQSDLKLRIVPSFGIEIAPDNKAIQLHRWSELPNTNLSGRQWVGELSQVGGILEVDIDNTHRWVSVFAKNPANNGAYDGVCFVVNRNTITLLGF